MSEVTGKAQPWTRLQKNARSEKDTNNKKQIKKEKEDIEWIARFIEFTEYRPRLQEVL